MENIVAPSLLSCDFMNIQKEVQCFEDVSSLWLHLDIMDGHFVPNLTFGLPIVKQIAKLTSLPLDAHFMVKNPEFHLKEFIGSGIHNFTFHYEACSDPLKLIIEAKKHFPCVGISLRPKTPVSVLSNEILKQLGLVLIMSVEPGFGGQSFIEGTWDKIEQINKKREELNLQFHIQIDGGVGEKNAQRLRNFGANNLVAGSYIFKEGPSSYLKKIDSLR